MGKSISKVNGGVLRAQNKPKEERLEKEESLFAIREKIIVISKSSSCGKRWRTYMTKCWIGEVFYMNYDCYVNAKRFFFFNLNEYLRTFNEKV
jgi:hypothetical protein